MKLPKKITSLKEILKEINPDPNTAIYYKRWTLPI